MSPDEGVPVGIIESFFGRPWRWSDRADTAGFLKEIGFDFYIYAPKADPYLRRRWREPLPAATAEALAETAWACRRAGIAFGLGLSPFELYRAPAPAADSAPRSRSSTRSIRTSSVSSSTTCAGTCRTWRRARPRSWIRS